jgi:hypothetical protein
MIDVLRGFMLKFSTLFVDSVCMCVCISCCRTFANIYFSVQMKLKDVEGAYHCPLCNKPSVQDVVGCDNCMEWFHLKCLCLTKEPPNLKSWIRPWKQVAKIMSCHAIIPTRIPRTFSVFIRPLLNLNATHAY